MIILLWSILIACLINVAVFTIYFIIYNKHNKKKVKVEHYSFNINNFVQIEEHVIEDLTLYCKEKYNLEVFKCFDIDQISLAYKDGEKNSVIIYLKFPMSDRGTPEYSYAVEYMKEEIDEWRMKNA